MDEKGGVRLVGGWECQGGAAGEGRGGVQRAKWLPRSEGATSRRPRRTSLIVVSRLPERTK